LLVRLDERVEGMDERVNQRLDTLDETITNHLKHHTLITIAALTGTFAAMVALITLLFQFAKG